MPRTRSERGSRTIHPVIVMGSTEDIIETKVECVLILEISNNLVVDKDYQVDVKSLFPLGTKISGECESCDKEGGYLSSVLQGWSTPEHIE
jgi:hypothetical protein